MPSRTVRLALAAGCAAAVLAVSGCSSGSSSSAASSAGSASAAASVSGTITVFAAASLQDTFTTLGKQFEATHPGTKVVFNFAGSDALAASIVAGAPADVFAAASPATMKTVTDQSDAVGTPKVFVRNELEIAVVPGNPQKITTLQDLAKPGLKVVLCAKQVPCGAAAQTVLTTGNVQLTPASYEADVKSALTKVELDEADASLVYQTDVLAAGSKVTGVNFHEASSAINDYPIAPLTHAPNSAGAAAFVALVESPDGRKVLTAAGFMPPS
ncbi:molybdate transport system substrate-binding protein [Kitasatospora sp. MAA4]|uniref:molybdate ABC transporter substrate-binding protein n=1 Tax=Kitasatospora sp. MAA4 TaxID=3035093 RepID=UPI0024752C73|nr:molybdate ABC transporter substrate-binding protein [Kitasatospora sp. MAA4]MDH6131481.1 molybdate transport system substrate-binding protein [Kitasatospora sp. MAA4]